MPQIDLEKAYANKQQSAQKVADGQKTLADLQQQVQAASEALAADTAEDTTNDQVLSAGAAAVPPGSLVLTSDGTILIAFNGAVHAYTKDEQVQAATVTFDDGQGSGSGSGSGSTPGGDTGGTPAQPASGPAAATASGQAYSGEDLPGYVHQG
jgi:hypothetical protein